MVVIFTCVCPAHIPKWETGCVKTHRCIFSSSGGSPAACVLKGPHRLEAPWCFFSHPWGVLLASLNRVQLELNFFCPYRDGFALNMLSVYYHVWPVSLRNESTPSLSRGPLPSLLVQAAYFCGKCRFFVIVLVASGSPSLYSFSFLDCWGWGKCAEQGRRMTQLSWQRVAETLHPDPPLETTALAWKQLLSVLDLWLIVPLTVFYSALIPVKCNGIYF